ncbi:pore-forming tail tip protein [Bacillus phage vB_BcgM]|nr:pore-forming tail tip protein [Bacillus phage vB_BcgM]
MIGEEFKKAIDTEIEAIKESIVELEAEAKIIEAKILENIVKAETDSAPQKVSVSILTDLDCERILSEARGALHIEEVINRYGDDRDGEDPTQCVWQDVEGLDYGWMWLRYKEEHMKEVMIAHITESVRALQKRMSDGEEFPLVKTVVDDDTVSFHVLDTKENQDSTVWTFSSKDTYLA